MKDAIYYTIYRKWGRYRVLAVTSEARYGRINGRFVEDDQPTHCTDRDVIGKFDTADAAKDKVADVKQIQLNYETIRKPHKDAISKSHHDEEAEIKALLK